jgi:LmbE family N-acetylglucosaminyl deacetylase
VAAPTPDLSAHSLLAVFAHPDDESLACGGLFARCADGGARVALVCLTRGEHGPGAGREPLSETRARELAEAARVLGIRDVVLLEHEDGMLPWIDPTLLEADVADAIRRFRPDVVVTFDADGLYWHPDHIAVHERVTAAVVGMGDAGPALFYVSLPSGAMRALVDAVAGRSAHGEGGPRGAGIPAADRVPAPILGVADPDAFGSMAPPPTLILDAAPFAGRKLAALRCHRSQVEGGPLDRLEEHVAARFFGTEHYRRADVGSRAEAFIERLGVPVAAGGD